MNNKLSLIAAAVLALSAAPAASAAVAVVHGRVPVSELNVARSSHKLMLSMDLDLSQLHLGKDGQVEIVPVVHNADSTQSVEFQPVVVAGHNLYFKHLREADMQTTPPLFI